MTINLGERLILDEAFQNNAGLHCWRNLRRQSSRWSKGWSPALNREAVERVRQAILEAVLNLGEHTSIVIMADAPDRTPGRK